MQIIPDDGNGQYRAVETRTFPARRRCAMINTIAAVWQAQGVLMARHDVDADQALALLCGAADAAGRSVAEEAQSLVHHLGRVH